MFEFSCGVAKRRPVNAVQIGRSAPRRALARWTPHHKLRDSVGQRSIAAKNSGILVRIPSRSGHAMLHLSKRNLKMEHMVLLRYVNVSPLP